MLTRSKLLNLMMITICIIVLVKSDSNCLANQYKCPNGICIDGNDPKFCATLTKCNSGDYLCNQNVCTTQKFKCAIINCPNQKNCWTGACVNDYNQCPSPVTCPLTLSNYLVKCHDFSCVNSINNCLQNYDCPIFLNYKCPNNDCRSDLKDCAQLPQCPEAFPMMCNDFSCHLQSDGCQFASAQTQCSAPNLFRCSSGTCETSRFLCPTTRTCPSDYVVCWDGDCAKNYQECKKAEGLIGNTCGGANLIRCQDGTCQSSINNCPTLMVCPISTPVRCWDNSCKEHIDSCPKWQNCRLGYKSCPDGTCVMESSGCATQSTCVGNAKYKCYDNTCRSNPKDCPKIGECDQATPIRCWDGKCVTDRSECEADQACPAKTMKCPDGTCRKDYTECVEYTKCPIGFVKCKDNSCRRNVLDCPSVACPLTFPFLCPNGACSVDKKKCDKPNGCPYDKPSKCQDGSCAKDSKSCPIPNLIIPQGKKLCPDGSIINVSLDCMLINGCPVELPKLCADHSCVKQKDQCSNSCPQDFPIKCENGLCVKSSSMCPNVLDLEKNIFSCPEGQFACGDGSCQLASSLCKPLFPCPFGGFKCQDGSCRPSEEFCPNLNTCPVSTSGQMKRCPNGYCAMTLEYCFSENGCSGNKKKCAASGLCVSDLKDCTTNNNFAVPNGCPPNAPYKCSNDGSCVSSDPSIDNSVCVYNACPNRQSMCPNGECMSNPRDCPTKPFDKCPSGKISCVNDNSCQTSIISCRGLNFCQLSSPFRCIDGSCSHYPNLLSKKNSDGCSLGIECGSDSSFLCADGSCKENQTFCDVIESCPVSQVRCSNRVCKNKLSECPANTCPMKGPILCANGNCRNSINHCLQDYCPDSLPIKCTDSNCYLKPSDCLIYSNDNKSVINCPNGEAICYDGSCRPDISMCPIYNGCVNPKNPIKCPNGICTNDITNCQNLAVTCDQGTTLCEDGICRKDCPAFNGCPNSAPVLCPFGFCVTRISECAGYSSSCPLDSPFRCSDGKCMDDLSKCPPELKNSLGSTVSVFLYPNVKYSGDLLLDDFNDKVISSISVPSNALQSNSTNDPTMITFSVVPNSKIKDTKLSYTKNRMNDIAKLFPEADMDNSFNLEYQYVVLSPVLNFTIPNSQALNNPMVLTLGYQFLTKNKNNEKLWDNDDICIGLLDEKTRKWGCSGLSTSYSRTDVDHISASIAGPGIYSVLFSPKVKERYYDFTYNFWIINLDIILIVVGIFLLLLLIGFYVFMRIYRYRSKYKNAQKMHNLFEIQMKELAQFSAANLSETLGDKIENIMYTSNPAFKAVKVEAKTSSRAVELMSLYDSIAKRNKALEINNEQIKNSYQSLQFEVERLKEYYEFIAKEKNDEESFDFNLGEQQRKTILDENSSDEE